MDKSRFNQMLGSKIEVENIEKNSSGKAYIGKCKSDGSDVYVLSEKNSGFITIAIIYDPENDSIKYVAADEGLVMIEPYIRNKTIDRDDLEFYCLYEKSCGSIIYKMKNHERFYFIIENKSGHIGFPKGHMEFGESESETAVREVFEETGIRIHVEARTRQAYTYKTDTGVEKTCVYFCSSFEENEIYLQEGEILRCWLVPYETALSLLNFPQDVEILKKAAKIHD